MTILCPAAPAEGTSPQRRSRSMTVRHLATPPSTDYLPELLEPLMENQNSFSTRARAGWATVRPVLRIVGHGALELVYLLLKVAATVLIAGFAGWKFISAWRDADGSTAAQVEVLETAVLYGIGAIAGLVTFHSARFALERLERLPPASIERNAGAAYDATLAAPTRLGSVPRERAAHEARHAVVAAALGFTVTYVGIRQVGASGGRTLWQPRGEMPLAELRWAEAVVSAAPAGYNNGCAQSDDTLFLAQLVQIAASGDYPAAVPGPLPFAELVDAALAAARTLVKEHEVLIDELTELLMDRDELEGNELTEFLSLDVLNMPS